MHVPALSFLLLALTVAGAQIHKEPQSPKDEGFKYDEGDPLGPDHWRDKYKTCSGKYQSPIHIQESLVTAVSLPPLNLHGFNSIPISANATNNGHTVLLKFNVSEPVAISGGPLNAPLFNFSQMHFHWGSNDSVGSEDLINNRSYPMELHMVFYNNDYKENEIADHNDGIVVLAFFFEISKHDVHVYDDLISAVKRIRDPDTTTPLLRPFTLASLLPTNLDNYFTYIGSLTTPPCSEGVRWIDFKHPIYLSHSQLQQFRNLRSHDGYLTHNYRPVQPLSNRPVWYNVGEPTNLNPTLKENAQPHKNHGLKLAPHVLLALFVGLIHLCYKGVRALI